jgi:peptidoglycan hydrolase-like protein with peptidoglycan-binding domain
MRLAKRLGLAALSGLSLLLAGVPAAAAPQSPAAATTVKVAFLQGEQIVYVDRPGSTVRAAVSALLAGPTRAEQADEIASQVPPATPLRGVSVTRGVATVDVGEKFALGTNAESLSARITQLVLTATRVPQVRAVRVLVKGGTPLGLFPGVVTLYPLTAKDVAAPDLPPPGPPAPSPPGTPSEATLVLQQRLADLGFVAASGVDGRAGPQTTSAVVAFQKWTGLPRDGVVGPSTQAALAAAGPPAPIRPGSGRRAEVLLDRQLTLLIDGTQVTRVLDVSTGKPGYETPAGSFSVFRKELRSWSVPYKVWLPWASYFVGGVAFHEYPDIPPVPASHGCVRVPRWDAEWLYGQIPNGTPVTVISRSR